MKEKIDAQAHGGRFYRVIPDSRVNLVIGIGVERAGRNRRAVAEELDVGVIPGDGEPLFAKIFLRVDHRIGSPVNIRSDFAAFRRTMRVTAASMVFEMLTAPADLNEIPDQINRLPHPQECEEVYENFADCRHERGDGA